MLFKVHTREKWPEMQLGSRPWPKEYLVWVGKDPLKTKGCSTHTRKPWPSSGQKWNYRALKINEHLGLRNVWCESEEQLKTLGLQCTKEPDWVGPLKATNGTWGHQKSIGIQNLDQCLFGVNMKKFSSKLWFKSVHKKDQVCPLVSQMESQSTKKLLAPLGMRNIWPEFEKDWIRPLDCTLHTRNLCGGSGATMTNAYSFPVFHLGIQ